MRPAQGAVDNGKGEGGSVSRVDELNLEGFSLLQLEELSERVAKEIVSKREARSRELREEMVKLAEREGLTLEEVIRAGQKPRKKQPPKQKYRNPDKPSQTWSGRGKKPGWVEKALEQGKSLKDLQI
jgi:DNA-binding protein H-NS